MHDKDAAKATIEAVDPVVKIDGEVVSNPEIVAAKDAAAEAPYSGPTAEEMKELAAEIAGLQLGLSRPEKEQLIRSALAEAGHPSSQLTSLSRKLIPALEKRGLF
jgi:hypothetical protein